MRKNEKDCQKSEVNSENDGLGRTFYGSPTIGGAVIVLIVVGFVLYSLFK